MPFQSAFRTSDSEPLLELRAHWFFVASVLLFVVLAGGNSLARMPWWDEGLFSDVSLSFRNFGHLGSSVLSPTGYLSIPGVNQYTYWQMPLYLVALGAWLRVVPFTVVSVRLFSVLWGLIDIGAWFVFVRGVSRNRTLAFFVAALVAFDYSVIGASSDGRMDMMCVALGQVALATYVSLRRTHWNLALASAAWFGAASFFSHPMGILMNAFLGILVLLDWRQVRWTGLLSATIPYLAGGALCVRYAMQNIAIYRAQSAANASYRISTLPHVLHHLFFDFQQRYLGLYLFGETGLNKLKVFSLLFGLVGFAALLLQRRLRLIPLSFALLLFSAISYIGLAVLDNQTQPVYLVYTTPLFTACGAAWTFYERPGSWKRYAACALLTASVIASVGAFGYKIYKNEYRSLYVPALAAIRANTGDGGLVMGGSELGFALGFKASQLVDDRYLGYGSKLKPEVFVSNAYYGEFEPAHLHQAWVWSRKTLQDHYHLVFRNSAYQVYKRTESSARE